MNFSAQVADSEQLGRVLAQIREVAGVVQARRK
jgi:hypothetical protein